MPADSVVGAVKGHVEKKRGRYYVVLELEADVGTGKRKRKWIGGFARKKEADEALVEPEKRRDVHQPFEKDGQGLS